MTRVTPRIDRVFADKQLIGAALDLTTRSTWMVGLKAASGLTLNDQERDIFSIIAGGRKPPPKRVREFWADVGRRGGKSEMSGALAIYQALFPQHRLSRGEVGMVLVIAGSRDQAKVVFNYARGILDASPVLRKEVAAVTQSEITLRNGIVIAVHSNSFRTVRGRTLVAAIFDEIGFWRDESSATPDVEVYRAVLPALATTNGILIGISTPYRKLGLLYQKYRDYFGVDSDDVLVIKGSTQTFNPTLSDATIAAQKAADPTAAISEWDAEFRADIASLFDDELIEAAIEHGRPLELPPSGTGYYKAFCDASGGVGHDSYTVAVGHKQADHFIIDVVRGTVGKFDPQEVTRQYAQLLKEYRVGTVFGDNYAAQWVAGAWSGTGVAYVKSDLPKSQIYLECIPLFTRGLVRLPDHAKLIRELRLLERHVHRSGKDSVENTRKGTDDYANTVCGVLRSLSRHYGYDTTYHAWSGLPDLDADPVKPDREPSAAQSRLVDLYRGIAACFGPSLPNPPTPRPLPPCNRSADGNWWKQR
jgi:hypothetical protein